MRGLRFNDPEYWIVADEEHSFEDIIGRIDYDPDKHKARVGFLRMPTRALVSSLAPENPRISVVAGAGFEPATSGL